MIHTNIKTVLLLTFCLFALLQVSAQKLENLTPKQETKVKQRWSTWTHTGRVTLNDSSSMLGQVIYPIDSGLAWRSVPQYFPYADTNIYLLPYRDISRLQINRPPRINKHILNGGIIGGVLFASATYAGPHLFHNENPGIWAIQSSLGVIAGMATGFFTGIVIDKIREQQVIYQPNMKNIQKATFMRNLLYTRKRKDFWRKGWVVNDSLIKDYPLPPELDKLRPYNYKRRLQVSAFVGMTSGIVEPSIQVDNGSVEVYNYGYYLTPRFVEIRATYQLKPWLKVGAFTHQKEAGNKQQRVSYFEPNISVNSEGSYGIKYERSFGVFAEYTPFPVTHLTLRKWDFHLGTGLIRNVGQLNQSVPFSYFTPDFHSIDAGVSNQTKFVKFGAITYLGLSIHLSRNISIETQFGYYFFPKHEIEGFKLDIIDPYKDIIFSPHQAKLSRSYLSLGASLRL